jgi:hypothetical protein
MADFTRIPERRFVPLFKKDNGLHCFESFDVLMNDGLMTNPFGK